MLELHNIFGRHILLRGLRTLPVVAVGAIVTAVTVLAIPIALFLDVTITLAVGLRVSCCKWAFRKSWGIPVGAAGTVARVATVAVIVAVAVTPVVLTR